MLNESAKTCIDICGQYNLSQYYKAEHETILFGAHICYQATFWPYRNYVTTQ